MKDEDSLEILKKAEEIDADLVLATDPDADRVGIAVKNLNGEFQLLNGNQTGALLVYYILKLYKESGKVEGNEFAVKTIVTTELITEICKSFVIEMYDVLTGFKYIAGLIRDNEGEKKYLVGADVGWNRLQTPGSGRIRRRNPADKEADRPNQKLRILCLHGYRQDRGFALLFRPQYNKFLEII